MKPRVYAVLMVFGLIAALSGCAGSKIYLMDLNYLAEKKAAPTATVVGICPFEDVRESTDKDLVGVRYHGKKHVDLFKLEGVSLSEAVTQAVRDYFTDNGIKVTDCKGWDGSPEGLDRLPRDLDRVIGGTIDSFMIEAKSGVSITTISYTIKMRVLIGKIDERKVVIRTVESTPRDKTVGFDPEKIKGKLNSIVTEALQKLLAEGLL
jgi:hypothetical protein